MKLSRKKIVVIILVILVVAGGVVGTLYLINRQKNEAVNEDKQELFTNLASSEESCSEANISELSKLYSGTTDAKDKAELAREVAHCYSLTQKYQDASTWYERSVDSFSGAGDTVNKDLMQKALDHAKAMTSQKEIIDIEGGTPEESVGQN